MASMEVKIIIASNQGVKPSCSLVQRLLQTTRYKYQLKSDKSSPILTFYHPKDKSDQTQLLGLRGPLAVVVVVIVVPSRGASLL